MLPGRLRDGAAVAREGTTTALGSGRVRVKPTITHVLHGLGEVPKAFEITANKGKYQAINPAQVMMRS